MEKETDQDIFKIQIFPTDDERLKILGELLSNKTSRDITKLLIYREMYTNEIAKELDLRRSLVIHHLQRMNSIGILEIKKRKITKKGEEHRFFRIAPGCLIIPTMGGDNSRRRVIEKLRKGIKYAGVAIIAYSSLLLYENNFAPRTHGVVVGFDSEIINSTVFPIIGIIAGLALIIILEKIKR